MDWQYLVSTNENGGLEYLLIKAQVEQISWETKCSQRCKSMKTIDFCLHFRPEPWAGKIPWNWRSSSSQAEFQKSQNRSLSSKLRLPSTEFYSWELNNIHCSASYKSLSLKSKASLSNLPVTPKITATRDTSSESPDIHYSALKADALHSLLPEEQRWPWTARTHSLL